MSTLTTKKEKSASELYALMDASEIAKDLGGKVVDGAMKVATLGGNLIDLGNSYLEEEITLRETTSKMRMNIEKDKIALKAYNRRQAMMDGVDKTEFEKFKKDMGK